jgi:hypothetical protein
MKREYYKDRVASFLTTSPHEILGKLVQGSEFPTELPQRDAWLQEIDILRRVLLNLRLANRNLQPSHHCRIYFEYSVPRMGKRIDALLLIGPVLFVLEFKVGETEFTSSALDQVCDYGLDLKNFHESSREVVIAPILIATRARPVPFAAVSTTSDRGAMAERVHLQGPEMFRRLGLSLPLRSRQMDAIAPGWISEADRDGAQLFVAVIAQESSRRPLWASQPAAPLQSFPAVPTFGQSTLRRRAAPRLVLPLAALLLFSA